MKKKSHSFIKSKNINSMHHKHIKIDSKPKKLIIVYFGFDRYLVIHLCYLSSFPYPIKL